MKKVILFSLLLLTIGSCKEKKTDVAPAAAADDPERIDLRNAISAFWDSVTTLSSERQEEINNYKFISDECQDKHKIVIDLSSLSAADQTAWTTKHPGLLTAYPGSTDKHYFDVFKYIDDNDDYTKEILGDWLKENGQFISFTETADYILCVHEVQPQFYEDFMNNAPEAKIKFSEIKAEAVRKQPLISFARPNYKYFIKFDFDGNNNLTIDPRGHFVPDGGYFSIPLLMEVVDRYGPAIKDDTEFEFRRIVINKNLRTFFSVKEPGPTGKYHCYDFSQIPSGVTTTLKPNAFSPF